MPVNIICKSDQFHSNYRKIPSDHVRTLNEKLDLIYYYQKFGQKVKMTDQFLGSNFQFHGYETKKKVTNSDYQNYEGIGNISKIRPRF